MLSEERRREILELLQKEGRVLVGELAKHFDTSLITIRKDLEFLHHQGQLERTHGGALPLRTGALHDQTLQEKERLHRKEKMRIAEAAVKMIRPGQVVILDSGTTTTAIARGCRHFRSLTIVTNAINIVEELAGTSVEVILTGGTLRTNSFSLVGPLAEESLRRLNADMLFSGGGRIRHPVWIDDAESAGVPREIARWLKRRVGPSWFATPANLGAEPFADHANFAVHETITDKKISKQHLKALRDVDIEVTLV